jgi:hypothetical protein
MRRIFWAGIVMTMALSATASAVSVTFTTDGITLGQHPMNPAFDKLVLAGVLGTTIQLVPGKEES